MITNNISTSPSLEELISGRYCYTPSELAKSYLTRIDQALEQGIQLEPLTAAITDRRLMPELVKMANAKNNNLNIHFSTCPIDFSKKVLELQTHGESAARFIVNVCEDGAHFAALDYALIDGKVSVIGIEPAALWSLAGLSLAISCEKTLKAHLPDASFIMIDSNMQNSGSECGMFSLFMAKKMFKEQDHFLKLHHENIAGSLAPNTSIGEPPAAEADPLLPPSIMKHTQSQKRLERYLAHDPAHNSAAINKKNEVLLERFKQHKITININGKEITYNNSIELKRKTELHNLINSTARIDTKVL